jgi:hypothetical protein
LANTGLSSERGQRAWKDIQRGVRKLLLDDKAWKNNDKGIENFTQAFYNYYLERQQEEMKSWSMKMCPLCTMKCDISGTFSMCLHIIGLRGHTIQHGRSDHDPFLQ